MRGGAKRNHEGMKLAEHQPPSSDTLLAIYVLRVLKKYSSVDNKITAKEVYKHLVDEHYINDRDNSEATIKKIRRYLHS